MSLQIIILAAGQGKRMYSTTPKVLHQLGGKSLLERVVETAQQLNPDAIHVIYGHKGQQLREAVPHLAVNWVLQAQQLGTGHAVMQALCHIPLSSQVLVLSADVPLVQVRTLRLLLDSQFQNKKPTALGLLVARLDDPSGLGRIVRNETGDILAIVEEKDATDEQRQINEIYGGMCCGIASELSRWLPRLSNSNAQGEYYLTEIISMAAREGATISSVEVPDNIEIQGVNNRQQLECLERVVQRRMANQLMLAGVTLADANRLDIRGTLECESDVFIDVNVVLSGKNTIGKGCHIGQNCYLENTTLGQNCEILPNTVIIGGEIGDNCHVGPFAHLRPGTKLAANCKIGNFVEAKKAVIDEGSKASHLSYLGDVFIGKKVNIGAGTITCNYDGANKYQTIIEDGAFIGSDTQLVAPVTIGANATIGAGSTIRRDVPPGELTLTESKQKTILGWKRPTKKK